MVVNACYEVNQYRLIQVRGFESFIQVFGAVDWWILVRAVQAADRDVMVRVNKECH